MKTTQLSCAPFLVMITNILKYILLYLNNGVSGVISLYNKKDGMPFPIYYCYILKNIAKFK